MRPITLRESDLRGLKHGHVKRVQDWPYSTFHRYVSAGIYPVDWCGDVTVEVGGD